jgi:uncharacterized protein (TIGR03663 family)
MFALVRRWLPLAIITATALWWRTHDLSRRPMHADEANQAVKLGELLEHGRYAFDPADHHGPTLYYAALPIAWMRGEQSLATLTETTVRLVPAIAGTLGVVLLFLLAAPFGRWPAAIAAALLAVAPASVYYSRYFIQETLLLTFVLAAAVYTRRWWLSGQSHWAVAAGTFVGLMQATKASAPLFVAAAVAAVWVLRCAPPASQSIRRDLALAVGSALLVAAVFYSSFGTHLSGLRDAFSTYAQASARATAGAGHEKSWTYYLHFFGWSRNGGLLWQQLLFAGLALGGAVLAWRRGREPMRAALAYTVIVGVALSLTPYKTPWHVIHLVPGLALLAAGALAAIPGRAIAVVLAAGVSISQWQQTRLAVELRPADARNPYAYVHSSPDVKRVRALAESALLSSPHGSVRVISEEYWPLPWYLRGLGPIGYWSVPPADCDGALIITSTTQAAEVRSRLRGNYDESYLGLRPGFICVVFTPVAP